MPNFKTDETSDARAETKVAVNLEVDRILDTIKNSVGRDFVISAYQAYDALYFLAHGLSAADDDGANSEIEDNEDIDISDNVSDDRDNEDDDAYVDDYDNDYDDENFYDDESYYDDNEDMQYYYGDDDDEDGYDDVDYDRAYNSDSASSRHIEFSETDPRLVEEVYATRAADILATLKYIVQFDDNDGGPSSPLFFSILKKLISLSPQITEEALQLMQKFSVVDADTLQIALKTRPDLYKEIYQTATAKGFDKNFMNSVFLDIIKTAPEYADIVLDEYIKDVNARLQAIDNDYAHAKSHKILNEAYEVLASYETKNLHKLVKSFENLLQNDLNDEITYEEAISYWKRLYRNHPTDNKDIFRLLDTEIGMLFEQKSISHMIFNTLSDVAYEHEETIPEILTVMENFGKKIIAASPNMDAILKTEILGSLYPLNSLYETIIDKNPSYTPRIINLLDQRISDKKLSLLTNTNNIDLLYMIVSKHSAYEDEALQLYRKLGRTDQERIIIPILMTLIDDDKLWLKKLLKEDRYHSGGMNDFAITPQVFRNFEHNWEKVLPFVAECEENNLWTEQYIKYTGFNYAFAKFVEYGRYNQYTDKAFAIADKVFAIIKTGIQEYDTVADSCFDFFAEYAKINPQRTGEILDLYKKGMKCRHCFSYLVNNALDNFFAVINNNCAKYKEDFLEIHKIGLEYSLYDTFNSMYRHDITGAIPQTLDIIKMAMASDKIDGASLDLAYKLLRGIIDSRPDLADQAIDIFNTAINSEKNSTTSLSTALTELGEIAYKQPDVTGKVLQILRQVRQTREMSFQVSTNFYNTLELIVINQPHFSGEILDIASRCKDANSLEKMYTFSHFSGEFLDTTSRSEDANSLEKMYIYKLCMRHLPLAATLASYSEISKDLQTAYNGRFASQEEFYYALGHFDEEVLTAPERRFFHHQQADFTMLLEREAALNGIPGKEICRYRHADASERVSSFYEEQKGWIVPSSFKTSQLFTRKAQEKIDASAVSLSSYLDKAKKCGLSPHDAVDMLPEPVNPEVNARVVGFIHRNLERILKDRDNLDDLKLIINSWDAVEQKLQTARGRAEICRINDKGMLTDNLDYKKVLKLCRSILYNNQRSDVFAAEAAGRKNNVSANRYHQYEDIYLAGLKVPEPFDSKQEFKCGDYTARFLPREDPRVGFFGNYTDCCQHFDGIGDECAVSTVMQPFSQLFVVENKQGEIIAGSWVWENTEGKYRDVCFDNIEIKGDFTKESMYTLREERNDSVANVIECLDEVNIPELITLWKEYFQILRDYDIQAVESIENKKQAEKLKKVSQAIDNKLQAKEVRRLEGYNQLLSVWNDHKSVQQRYASHKKVADTIEKLYEQAGDYLISPEVNCRRVTIGKGRQDVDITSYTETESISLPRLYHHGYSDAEHQVLLTENPQASPLDKTKESQRYVRDVCYLDIPAMEEVCAAVFPSGDQKLEKPSNEEDLAGFVIEDREKGVVGYCLYEKMGEDAHYIPDAAVLPEYRTDENASSKKLFAEMMRCVREKGGTWYAEMREETSLRYLKAMAARGLAKYEILSDEEAEELGLNATRQMEYDPQLKVASKVYPLRFEAVRDDVRQAAEHARDKVTPDNVPTAIKPISPLTDITPTPPHFTGRGGNGAENSA